MKQKSSSARLITQALLVTMTLILFQGCKKDETKAATNSSDLNATAGGGGGDNTIEKDAPQDDGKNKDKTGQLDEKAINLLELEKIWKDLDFKKHKIRAEGYVTSASIHEKMKNCIINLSYYPYTGADIFETFKVKNLSVQFDPALYATKEECEGLKAHRISLYILNPLPGEHPVGFAKEAIINDEEAVEDFKQFYQNLLANKYPQLKTLALADFIKTAIDKNKEFLKTKVVKGVASDKYCKLLLTDADDGEFIQLDIEADKNKNRSEAELTKENCANGTAGKTIVAYGSYITGKQVSVESYLLSDQE